MKLIILAFCMPILASFSRCSSPKAVDNGVICIQDSVGYPGDATRNIYVYYRDYGLMGRGDSTYVSIEPQGKFLSEKHWFYSDNGIMLIDTKADSLFIFTATRKPTYIESSEIKYRVIVDTQTWKYPHPKCYPVKP